MNNSSQQPDYSTTLSNFTSDDIITLTSSVSDYTFDTTLSTINLDNMSITLPPSYATADTITLSNVNLSSFNWEDFNQTEFVNTFPSWEKVEEMRKEYPALDIALKKFQEVYTMVEDDWQAQKGQKYVR